MISERYYYSKFSVSQQILYKKIYDAVLRYDEYVICGENDYEEADFNIILQALLLDNPDVFYVKNAFSIEKTSWGLIKLYPQYYFNLVDKEQITLEIEKQEQRLFLSIGIKDKCSEEIAKEVHDFLITNTSIEKIFNLEKCPVVETLLENKMTAQGVAYTYKYLLNSIGIDCNIIYDYHNEMNGNNIWAWNCIKLYGEDRYVNIYEDALSSGNSQISYEYFGVTDELILRNQSILIQFPDKGEEQSIVEVKDIQPNVCTSDKESEDFLNIASANVKTVDGILNFLKEMFPVMQSDTAETIIEQLILQLENLKEIENQYVEDKETLENGVMVHFPELLRILKEYYRYKKYSASSNLIDMLYGKLSIVIDTLMKAIQYNINLFWNNHAHEMIDDMSEMQHNLVDEKRNRKKCPIDINTLDENSDLDDFISILEYLKIYGLSQQINELVVQLLESMKCLQQAMKRNEDKTMLIDSLKNYYLPEAIRLIFLYDEYEDEGINKDRLKDLYENINTSLRAVNNAIQLKLDEINALETMETKARAMALTDIIGQDGYTLTQK